MQQSEFRSKLINEERRKWKWSSSLKGPIKIPANDPLRGFRVKSESLFEENLNQRVKRFEFQELFADDEPIQDNDFSDSFEVSDENNDVPIDLASRKTSD